MLSDVRPFVPQDVAGGGCIEIVLIESLREFQIKQASQSLLDEFSKL